MIRVFIFETLRTALLDNSFTLFQSRSASVPRHSSSHLPHSQLISNSGGANLDRTLSSQCDVANCVWRIHCKLGEANNICARVLGWEKQARAHFFLYFGANVPSYLDIVSRSTPLNPKSADWVSNLTMNVYEQKHCRRIKPKWSCLQIRLSESFKYKHIT